MDLVYPGVSNRITELGFPGEDIPDKQLPPWCSEGQ